MPSLNFAAFGAGFWTTFQLAGWREIGGTNCVAIYNRTAAKAEAIAARFQIPHWYSDAREMLDKESLDFVDIITGVETHALFTRMASSRRLPVVCQKPMATSVDEAEDMVKSCAEAGVPLLINENWRWQTPIREVKRLLDGGEIGLPFRARIDMVSGFPVFENQPFLRSAEQFILADLGSHILDVARFLFGEMGRLYCQTARVHADIVGEDVATVVLETANGCTVVCELAYAGNHLERDRFPETCIFVEGSRGSIELSLDFQVRITTSRGTHSRRVPPPRYGWADPAYDIVHSSIVPCQANLLCALKGEGTAETTGEDNIKSVRLVDASYESARTGQSVRLV
ncbi:putative oxidoreductase [Acidisarcina polymorpha]|uniref:Putative oxidoreductase n=1 Tax=Acidisarcina polymorpha TaxID=2211140 RepID=A0A2Z5G3Y0_9BACT|nr:Gfo/Idh/MocA family oxidoreductase [Acidisarcina polymorpha]AXC13893.1 putative oxidoreductase [Acidisarcina polymorpha]